MRLKTLLLFFLFLSISGATLAQSSAELKRRKAKLSREIESLKKQQNKIVGTKRLTLKQIDALNAQIRLREEKINTINSEVRLLDNQIEEKTSTVNSLKSQLSKLKKDYAAMVRFAFRNQSSYGKLMFIFASESFNQAYKRLKYLQQFSKHRKKQAAYIRETQQELGMKIVELDQNKRSKSELLRSQEVEKVTLSKEKITEAAELKKLSKQEKLVKRQVDSKRKELARLNRAISAAIKKEIAAARAAAARAAAAKAAAQKAAAAKAAAANKTAPKPSATTTAKKSTSVLSSTPAMAKLSSSFLGNRGRLPWPVQGTVVSRFGPSKNKNVSVTNTGIDIRTSAGASVKAVFSGEVRLVTDVGGLVVLIRHGEYFTAYSNLRSANVSVGQEVTTGQNIGSVKTDSDGTNLHFEIWKNTSPVNPEGWLNR
ncbi:murein hydrolase activator EnvC family protein [Paradesertivirga mongoliensis]|uniref:Murein hydrolase activator EnvC family protein n=1 Tax=Paradesertivirga mongoliensis TaxID=2100740 RepID=A0ABW4ZL02_9SPHI|nr:peptidoglycan DD-metalloendopeptidase family protein [Pedobacter mongoliensis]